MAMKKKAAAPKKAAPKKAAPAKKKTEKNPDPYDDKRFQIQIVKGDGGYQLVTANDLAGTKSYKRIPGIEYGYKEVPGRTAQRGIDQEKRRQAANAKKVAKGKK